MEVLLEEAVPIVWPLSEPVVGQLNAEFLVRQPVSSYPALLADVIGPPLKVGNEEWLGYVTAECALAAVRQHDLQAAFAMLFLSTLCGRDLQISAVEALNHLLTMSDGAVRDDCRPVTRHLGPPR